MEKDPMHTLSYLSDMSLGLSLGGFLLFLIVLMA